MAEPSPQAVKRTTSPHMAATAGGGAAGAALAQMIVEIANKAGAGLTMDFQTSLGIVLVLVLGWVAGRLTKI